MQPIIRVEELRAILRLDGEWMAMQSEQAISKSQKAKANQPTTPRSGNK